jgi:fluoride exporter
LELEVEISLMLKYLLIAIGGALGSMARYGTGSVLLKLQERTLFPFGTLAANLIGCLLIGYINGLLLDRVLRPEYRFLLVIGFLGGYTTFSSYGFETFAKMQDSQWLHAALNILANNLLGIALVMVGYGLSRLHH